MNISTMRVERNFFGVSSEFSEMVFGMMPLALGLGEGASQRAPMAHAVIGGLFTSTIFTLVVVPIIFTYLDGAARRVRSLFPKHIEEGSGTATPAHQPAE